MPLGGPICTFSNRAAHIAAQRPPLCAFAWKWPIYQGFGSLQEKPRQAETFRIAHLRGEGKPVSHTLRSGQTLWLTALIAAVSEHAIPHALLCLGHGPPDRGTHLFIPPLFGPKKVLRLGVFVFQLRATLRVNCHLRGSRHSLSKRGKCGSL